MNKIYKFENNDIFYLHDGNKMIISDKKEETFFELSDLEDIYYIRKNQQFTLYKSKISLFSLLSLIIVFILLSFFMLFHKYATMKNPNFLLYLILFLIFNVIIHELCHSIVLNLLGRKITKIGFKFTYLIFPTIYLSSNEAYMLHKYEKIIFYYL